MPRLTTLVLAGALGWPAVTFGQPWAMPRPADKAPAVTRPADPAETTPGARAVDTKPAETKPVQTKADEAALPPVPPLPPTGPLPASVTAANASEAVKMQKTEPVQELPKPAPMPPATAPDVSNMPPGVPPGAGYPYPAPGPGHMLPGTMAPTIPPVCCPPEPEPCTSCNQNGCFVTGDVFMIRARQATPVAVFQRNNAAVPQVVTSDLVQYNTDPTWGYRVGLGFLCDDGWIFQATYMQYKDLVSTQQFIVPDVAPDSVSIIYAGPGLLAGTGLSEPGALFTADWNLQLHQVDLVVGTVFSPAECLDLTVTAGARIAWLDQQFRVLLQDSNSTTSQDQRQKMQGFGPIVNTEARVHLKPGWSLIGRASTALLLGNREDKGTELITDPTGTLLNIRTASYDREEIVPVIELGFGTEFCCCNGHVTVGTGYEFMYWYELGSSYSELAGAQSRVQTKGDISLDGFYIRVTILF